MFLTTIPDLIEMAYTLIKGKSNNKNNEGYKCTVSKAQFECMIKNVFRDVLRKRQSKYGKVILWLNEGIAPLTPSTVS